MSASVLFHAGTEPVPAMAALASSAPGPATISAAPATHMPVATADVTAPVSPVNETIGAAAGEAAISLDDRHKEVEANLITWALKMSGGNKSKAAELLRIKRSTLGDRINRCGLGRIAGNGVAA
jgi:DNA-binding NtrC family response regulator